MNFFEEELRKVMVESAILKDPQYVGRICYGRIDEDIRARIEFVTLGVHDHYEGMKVSILNRKEGVVDSILLRFSDVWGRQAVNNPNFREGVMPHIWTDGGKSQWYVFQPAAKDYRKLGAGIERYLSVFQGLGETLIQEEGVLQQGD